MYPQRPLNLLFGQGPVELLLVGYGGLWWDWTIDVSSEYFISFALSIGDTMTQGPWNFHPEWLDKVISRWPLGHIITNGPKGYTAPRAFALDFLSDERTGCVRHRLPHRLCVLLLSSSCYVMTVARRERNWQSPLASHQEGHSNHRVGREFLLGKFLRLLNLTFRIRFYMKVIPQWSNSTLENGLHTRKIFQ